MESHTKLFQTMPSILKSIDDNKGYGKVQVQAQLLIKLQSIIKWPRWGIQ